MAYGTVLHLLVVASLAAGAAVPRKDAACVCVPYYQCSDQGVLNKHGEGILDERFGVGDLPVCPASDHGSTVPLVCCQIDFTTPSPHEGLAYVYPSGTERPQHGYHTNNGQEQVSYVEATGSFGGGYVPVSSPQGAPSKGSGDQVSYVEATGSFVGGYVSSSERPQNQPHKGGYHTGGDQVTFAEVVDSGFGAGYYPSFPMTEQSQGKPSKGTGGEVSYIEATGSGFGGNPFNPPSSAAGFQPAWSSGGAPMETVGLSGVGELHPAPPTLEGELAYAAQVGRPPHQPKPVSEPVEEGPQQFPGLKPITPAPARHPGGTPAGFGAQGSVGVDVVERPTTSAAGYFSPIAVTIPPGKRPPPNRPITAVAAMRHCGLPLGVGVRLDGGSVDDLPWMVRVWRQNSPEGEGQQLGPRSSVCGGSLILDRVVLTAAHCVATASQRRELITVSTSLSGGQEAAVRSATLHPEYEKSALLHDVALLFLETPILLGTEFGTATLCLLKPPPPHKPQHQQHDTKYHTDCFVTGFGPGGWDSRSVSVPLVPRDRCQEQLRTTRLGAFFQLHPSFVCAGGEEGKDTCKGDGGSPLVCAVPVPGTKGLDKVLTQVGLTSWGIGCSRALPGVYASTEHASSWVAAEVKRAGFVPELFLTPL